MHSGETGISDISREYVTSPVSTMRNRVMSESSEVGPDLVGRGTTHTATVTAPATAAANTTSNNSATTATTSTTTSSSSSGATHGTSDADDHATPGITTTADSSDGGDGGDVFASAPFASAQMRTLRSLIQPKAGGAGTAAGGAGAQGSGEAEVRLLTATAPPRSSSSDSSTSASTSVSSRGSRKGSARLSKPKGSDTGPSWFKNTSIKLDTITATITIKKPVAKGGGPQGKPVLDYNKVDAERLATYGFGYHAFGNPICTISRHIYVYTR